MALLGPAENLRGAAVWAHWAYVAAVLLTPWAWPRLLPYGMPGLQVADFVIAIACGLTVVAAALRRIPWRVGWFVLVLFAYFAWTVVSWAANGLKPIHALDELAHAEMCCLAWCTLALAGSSAAEFSKVLAAWLATGAIAALAGLVAGVLWLVGVETEFAGFIGSLPFGVIRIAGPTISPNLLAHLLLVPWVLFCCAPQAVSGVLRVGDRGLLALRVVVGVCLLLTFSRTVVAAALAALWWGLGRLNVRAGKRIAVVACAAVLALSGLFYIARYPPSIGERASVAASGPGLPGIRYRLLRQGLEAAYRRPVLGYGPGSRPLETPYWNGRRFIDVRMDAHNTWVNVTLKVGLVGLVLFLCVFALSLAYLRSKREDPNGLGTGLALCLSAFAFTGFSIDLEDLRWFWGVMGLAVAWAVVRPQRLTSPG
jgi:O-antigen ligase